MSASDRDVLSTDVHADADATMAASSAEPDRLAEPVDTEEPPRLPFPVVGIGASAGGLEAFTAFFDAMPSDAGLAFVLVQHLPPNRESMIVEILARHTRMPVHEVEDGMTVAANHVYVIRPGRTLTIERGRLHLGDAVQKPGHSRPVDDFFKSLAAEQRERAICIVMSGMGSNGAAGARSIKAVGGICIAQDPDGAQYPSMPRHVMDAGCADFVLAIAEMPDALVHYATHPYATARGDGERELRRERRHVADILALVRTRMRLDFTGYKQPTVLRRIQRRMGLNRITTIEDYAKLLRQNPTEMAALCDDFLIHVTGFFRDAAAWEALRESVIVPLIAHRDPGSAVRCWVTACSTGEEAYSLAMMLIEECERANKALDVKVFATDMGERMLANARNGVYPGGIEAELSPQRLDRFFEREDAVYRVRQELRECVVFAPQNILQDPPFSRLDVITCRNLLIYLEPEVQQRVIALFHFGLREGGALFLGTSETVTNSDQLFESIDKKARLFRRIGSAKVRPTEFPLPHGLPSSAETNRETRGSARPSIAALTNRELLARHVPAAVTIDRNHRIVYFHGNTRPFFDQPTGEPTRDLLTLVTESIRGAVHLALQAAIAQKKSISRPDGWIETDDGPRRVIVTASPLEVKSGEELFVVSFETRDEPAPRPVDEPVDDRRTLDELDRVRRDLQDTIAELQASNEQHKAAAEEVMSINEELQSSNEELETSREEMQSLNEELTTVNAQLHAKMEEHLAASNDLSSLLTSTDIAVLFLDPQLRIRRFTPPLRELLDVIPSDVGRPLADLALKFDDPDLMVDARTVLEQLVPLQREIATEHGRWFLRRITPYRTTDNVIDGVVVTFVDITQRKNAEDRLLQNETRLRALVNASSLVIFRVSPDWTEMHQLRGSAGISEFESSGGGWIETFVHPDDRAAARARIETCIRAKSMFAFEHRVLRANGSVEWLESHAIPILDDAGKVEEWFGSSSDISERKRAEEGLERARNSADRANRLKDEFLATLSHELRTPLAAILSWGSVLRDWTVEPEIANEGIAAIIASGQSLARLVDDLMDASRITTGKLRLELIETDCKQIIQAALEPIKPTADAKGVRIDTRLAHDGAVWADPDRLRQVIWNLLSNAVKFTPATETVTVTTARHDERLVIEVADTGAGIDPEFLPFVFDRFRQFESSRAGKQGGLGLGLAIAKQLIELHGGTLRAASDGLGKGATFTIELPARVLRRHVPAAAPRERDDPDQRHLSGRKVLVIEDDVSTCAAVRLMLEHAGADVVTASTAADGFDAYERSQPTVIVSDIGLPDSDGYALLSRIRAFEAERSKSATPAIALTAYAREEDREKAMDSGYQLHLAKPVDLHDLVTAVTNLVAGAT